MVMRSVLVVAVVLAGGDVFAQTPAPGGFSVEALPRAVVLDDRGVRRAASYSRSTMRRSCRAGERQSRHEER